MQRAQPHRASETPDGVEQVRLGHDAVGIGVETGQNIEGARAHGHVGAVDPQDTLVFDELERRLSGVPWVSTGRQSDASRVNGCQTKARHA